MAHVTSGGTIDWVTQAGGSSHDYGFGIAPDDSGGAYLTGKFRGTAAFGNTPLTAGGGGYDVFVAHVRMVCALTSSPGTFPGNYVGGS